MTDTPSGPDDPRARLLDAAERLFYGRGFQAVGMDEVRAASGLPLKRIYRLYPTKQELIIGMLRRRDGAWRGRLADHVARDPDPLRRVPAVFDWLHDWFSEPDFRGCAWINAYGELAPTMPAVADVVREHKHAFRSYLADLVAAAGRPSETAEAVYLLAEGAMVAAAIDQDPGAAIRARTAAATLLRIDAPAV